MSALDSWTQKTLSCKIIISVFKFLAQHDPKMVLMITSDLLLALDHKHVEHLSNLFLNGGTERKILHVFEYNIIKTKMLSTSFLRLSNRKFRTAPKVSGDVQSEKLEA